MRVAKKNRIENRNVMNTFLTTKDEREALERVSRDMGISRSDLIRMALNEFLKNR